MGANPQGDGRGQTDLYWYVHNVFANFFKVSSPRRLPESMILGGSDAEIIPVYANIKFPLSTLKT